MRKHKKRELLDSNFEMIGIRKKCFSKKKLKSLKKIEEKNKSSKKILIISLFLHISFKF